MKGRWDVEYVNIRDFVEACKIQKRSKLWNRMVEEFSLIMGGVDFVGNFACVFSNPFLKQNIYALRFSIQTGKGVKYQPKI